MMSILNSPDTVVVRFESGVPCELVWGGIRYRVSDTPTPIRGSILHDLLTHPLEPIIGWRFQGTSDASQTHVFDVHEVGRQEWRLVAVYD
jgi:hypothetical protein